jgi:prefoldin beta subunit
MFPGQNIMEIMQIQLQEGVEKLQSFQKQQQKTLSARQMLDSQLNENKLVKEEMDKVKSDTKVFKLIGPALVRQEVSEAKQNVDKRIEYITGELKRQDDLLADLEKQQDAEREKLQNLQTQMQKLAQA